MVRRGSSMEDRPRGCARVQRRSQGRVLHMEIEVFLDSKHRGAIICFFDHDHGQWLEGPGGDKSFYARNAWKTPCRAIAQHDEEVGGVL